MSEDTADEQTINNLMIEIDNLHDTIDSAIEHMDAGLMDQAHRILQKEQDVR